MGGVPLKHSEGQVMWFLLLTLPLFVKVTSIKMDFLSAGTVRTDPLDFSETGACLSDHVHRFYGAVSNVTMRPEVSFNDLRAASGNTGNVEENKSLNWNPVIYQVVNPSSTSPTYQMVDVWFASAYYIWQTGKAKAFPAGLKMKASGSNKLARVVATCDGPYTCERTDNGGCSQMAGNKFFPKKGCGELEMSIKFPTCWDGQNIESSTGDHVMYAPECNADEHMECFEFDCPSSHPVRMPEIHLYVRVLGYEGGAHVFSDGSDVFHSDYFSGWDETKLQTVLDGCENDSEAANPTAFCSSWLTYRGKGKVDGVQTDDEEIRSDLETIQPPSVDTKATISPEEVTNIAALPRGVCTGTLLGGDNSGTTTTGQPTTTTTAGATTGFTCPAGVTSETITVEAGESLSYSTQEGARYTRNVDCMAKFRKGSSCQKLRLSCESFSLAKGDTMFVTKDTKKGKRTQRFRKKKFRTQVSSGALDVRFRSNKKKESNGAQCTVECV